jgi:hypothetical protein
MHYEQDQIDQAYMAQEDAFEAGSRFRFHIIVDSLLDDEAHVLDTHTGKTLFAGSNRDCDRYLQSH